MKDYFNELFKSLNYEDFNKEEYWDKYRFEDKFVPRVTEILSAMLHEDYLMKWSNAMGFKRKKYESILQDSANIGTLTHNAIENYLLYNTELGNHYDKRVENCFGSFMKWWNIISENDFKIIAIEKQLVCEYFGGTLDLLIEINGEVFLVDFKTSTYPRNYKYVLQLAAYRYMLREYYNINTDGCIILGLNKTKIEFDEILFHFKKYTDNYLFDIAEQEFLALVYAYLNRLNIKLQFDKKLEEI